MRNLFLKNNKELFRSVGGRPKYNFSIVVVDFGGVFFSLGFSEGA